MKKCRCGAWKIRCQKCNKLAICPSCEPNREAMWTPTCKDCDIPEEKGSCPSLLDFGKIGKRVISSTPTEKTLSVYDILPQFDSYIADVENNLSMDPVEWRSYLQDPAPYLIDMILDFGEFFPEGQDKIEIATWAVNRHCGK